MPGGAAGLQKPKRAKISKFLKSRVGILPDKESFEFHVALSCLEQPLLPSKSRQFSRQLFIDRNARLKNV